MNAFVGEKIKQLRKEMNMTQSDLAGNELTKSMLSQIENNISNPSIKTLQYIASRLNKPVSYFLENEQEINADHPSQFEHITNTNTQEELENIKVITQLILDNKLEEAKKEIELIKYGTTPEAYKGLAETYHKLGEGYLKSGNKTEGKKYLTLTTKFYTDGNYFFEAAKNLVNIAKIYYQEMNFKECLNISDQAMDLFYKSNVSDSLFEIELYYYKIILLFAIGDLRKATEAIEYALNLSSKTSVYYKTDEFHRLYALYYYLLGNSEEYQKNITKALQFATFIEDKLCIAKIYAVMSFVAYQSKDYDKALLYAEMIKDNMDRLSYIYYLIKGQVYYSLGNYELAYDNIRKVEYPSYETHKFDYLNMWSAKIYEGLILNKLGRTSDAINSIKMGIDKMSIVDASKFLVHAYKSLSEVYSEQSDFENAFHCLKEADELKEKIDRDETILF